MKLKSAFTWLFPSFLFVFTLSTAEASKRTLEEEPQPRIQTGGGGSYFESLKLAADQGDKYAQITLANMYRFGAKDKNEAVTVYQDIPIAVHYFKLAADQGDKYARLMLVSLYEYGATDDNGIIVFQPDFQQHLRYLKLVADPVDIYSRVPSFSELRGDNLQKYYAYLKLAADLKYPEALWKLGHIYYYGWHPFPKDPVAGVLYLQLAAVLGVLMLIAI